MSTLPVCDISSGYLPQGIHPATHNEIRQRFVERTPHPLDWGSPQRQRVFAGYERLIEALELAGLPTEQWIGGSFISKAPDPQDIDLVNFCDAHAYEALAQETRAMVRQYFLGEKTAEHCHCDSYFVPAPSSNEALKPDFAIIQAYWKKKLGHDRAGHPKGIISRLVEVSQPTHDHEEPAHAAAT